MKSILGTEKERPLIGGKLNDAGPAPAEGKPKTEAPGSVAQEVPEEAPARGESSPEVARLKEQFLANLRGVTPRTEQQAREGAETKLSRLQGDLRNIKFRKRS